MRVSYFLNAILLLTSMFLVYRWFDAEVRIEAGVLNEIYLVTDRQFLMALPELLNEAGDKTELVRRLEEKYPDVSVSERGDDICWGLLRLQFKTTTQLASIKEDCS